MKWVIGHVVGLDVVPNSLIVPVRQRVELPEPKPLVPTEFRRGCSGLAYSVDYVTEEQPFDEKIETPGGIFYVDCGSVLYLVGSTAMSGQYLAQLQQQIAKLGLDDAVTFAGSVTIEQLVAYYRGATAFLTLSDHEGFCVPLLEAMRSDMPIVAHAAGAIPETLGDAGVLLEEKSPSAVAAALERVVRDQAVRKDLLEKGHRRVEEFSREKVAGRLKLALAQGGWDLPTPRSKRVVVLSSDQRCGIHHYSLAVCDGLRKRGHHVTFVGVRHLDTADLQKKLRYIRDDVETILIEHEAGIFRDVPFVRALTALRRRGFPIVLSMHELEPEKFHHYRRLSSALHYRPRYRGVIEALRVPWVALG